MNYREETSNFKNISASKIHRWWRQ